MVLKLSHCGKQIRITRKVSNCVTGKKITKISWTDRVRNEEVFERVKKESNILYTIKRPNGLVTSCVGTAFSNTLLNEREK